LAAHQELEDQIRALTAQLATAPEQAVLYARRADLYRRHKDWDLALADYAAAAERDPSLDAVPVGRARIEADRGNLDQALEVIREHLVRKPGHGGARLVEARILARAGRRSEAIAAYDQAIQALPRPQPDHFLERADAMAGDGPAPNPAVLPGLDEGAILLGEHVSLHLRALESERALGDRAAALRRITRVLDRHGALLPWLVARAEILATDDPASDRARTAWREARDAFAGLPARRRQSASAREWLETIRAGLAAAESVPGVCP
jgi:tetratricopeptide (TPR) repeat protein